VGAGPTSYSYQWLRCISATSCAPIAGANSDAYTVSAADEGCPAAVKDRVPPSTAGPTLAVNETWSPGLAGSFEDASVTLV